MLNDTTVLDQFAADALFQPANTFSSDRKAIPICFRVKLRVWQGKNYSTEYSPWEETQEKLNRYIQSYLSEGFSKNCISIQRADYTEAEDPCKKNPQPSYWTLVNLRREQ